MSVRETCAEWQRGIEPHDDPALAAAFATAAGERGAGGARPARTVVGAGSVSERREWGATQRGSLREPSERPGFESLGAYLRGHLAEGPRADEPRLEAAKHGDPLRLAPAEQAADASESRGGRGTT